MLPDFTEDFAPNLMWPQVVDAYERSKRTSGSSGAGIIYEDRLRRNLLSSQPLCFNLFGYFAVEGANALLPWVRTFAHKAEAITSIRLEHAPSAKELGEAQLGGSAFDAFIEYRLPNGLRGFIGVETKYHENLAKALTLPREGTQAWTKYLRETEIRPWRPGAAHALMTHRKNLQFWYNQLLAQRTFDLVKDLDGGRYYSEFTEVVVATRQDGSARQVVRAVAEQLAEGHQHSLRFCSIDEVIDTVTGPAGWKSQMRERYTDFAPIQEHLPHTSPLKNTSGT